MLSQREVCIQKEVCVWYHLLMLSEMNLEYMRGRGTSCAGSRQTDK